MLASPISVHEELSDHEYAEARQIALRAATRVLRRADDCEDIAQDTLVKLMAADAVEMGNWRGWVSTVARNAALDYLRRDQRHGGSLDDLDFAARVPRDLWQTAGPSAAAVWPQIWSELTRALSERERELLHASLDGATNAELADSFGYASPAAVAVTMHRIRRKLRTSLADRERMLELLGVQRLY